MINRETLNSLDRNFPLIVPFIEENNNRGFLESRDKYLSNNRMQALWLLDNSELLLEVLQKYRRITEITFESKILNE